jgi:hypothetical protein
MMGVKGSTTAKAKTIAEYRKNYPNAFKAGMLHARIADMIEIGKLQDLVPPRSESWGTLAEISRRLNKIHGRILAASRVSIMSGEGEGPGGG